MKVLKMEEKKNGKLLFEFGIFFLILNLLCVVGIWQSILCDWQVSGEAGLFLQAYVDSSGKFLMESLNQQSLYLSLLSFVFSFLGNKEDVVLIVNLVLQLMGIFFLFLGARKSTGVLFALLTTLVSVVGSILCFPVAKDSPMHLMWFLCILLYWLCVKILTSKKVTNIVRCVLYVGMGILVGMIAYVDAVGFLPLVTILIMVLYTKSYQRKEDTRNRILFTLTIIVSMLGMIYLWNNCRLDISVFRNWFLERKAFVLQKESFMPYVFMTIVFFLQLILALIYNYQNKAEPVADVFLTEELQIQESKQVIENRNENTCTEEPEEKEIANSDKEQEEKPKVKLLDNPLPVPKKHIKKEMNYAFEPSEDQMHYDLNNYRVDDDYDLKTGL